MDKNAFYDKYIASEEDIYTLALEAMDSREYREKVASRRDSYRTLENIIRELPGAGELLRQ